MVAGVAILTTFVLTELISTWLDPRLRIVGRS
jgi:hypothetical protein